MPLPARDDAAVVMGPREEPFDLPTAAGAAQRAPTLTSVDANPVSRGLNLMGPLSGMPTTRRSVVEFVNTGRYRGSIRHL